MGNEAQNAKPILKKMLVEIPAGAALTASKKAPGAFSPLVHGPDGVASQAVLHGIPSKMTKFVDSGIADFLLGLAVAAAVAGGEAVIKKGVPKFRRYLTERRAVATTDAPARKNASGDVAIAHNAVETNERREDVAQTGPSLTSDQWYQLFFEAVAHGAAGSLHQEIGAERWRQLVGARIDDDPSTQELADAMRELTAEEVRAAVDRVFEEHPELRDEDPLLVLQRLLDENPRPARPRSLDIGEGEEQDPHGS